MLFCFPECATGFRTSLHQFLADVVGSMKTESEIYFEKFCERSRFALLPVSVTTTKTPDYTLIVSGQLVVVEVKEILPTDEELESERLARETGVGKAIGGTPGKSVRKKIADCSKQIKARTQGEHPGLLVLWEGGRCAGLHSEPYHIRVAMAGFEQVLVNVPPIASDLRPSFGGMKHGGSRKMTDDANTSISAGALLCMPSEHEMLLQVFHNRYAAIPLNPTLLTSAEVTQYVLRDTPNGTTEWKKA